jgi:hypothetical protein
MALPVFLNGRASIHLLDDQLVLLSVWVVV